MNFCERFNDAFKLKGVSDKDKLFDQSVFSGAYVKTGIKIKTGIKSLKKTERCHRTKIT